MRTLIFLCFSSLLFSCCHLVAQSRADVFKADEDKAIERIFGLIASGTVANPAAKLVRLVFHDCVGGCDGCLNLNNPDNNGLQDIYSQINRIYENEGYNQTGMSRADFIALAGTVAVRQASSLQSCSSLNLPMNCEPPTPNVTIKYGRTDCPTSPSTTVLNEFPNPHGNLTHVLDVFEGQMNMSVRQVVAILGAHTLGDAGVARSGFRGPWVPQTTVFNNMFYRQLRNPNNDWFQEEIVSMNSPVFPESRQQWTLNRQNSPNLMMLNTDVALWKYIQPDADGIELNATCRDNLNDCPPSDTADIVTEFANNNNAFHDAFGSAFQVLIENGYPSSALNIAIQDDMNTTSITPDSGVQLTSRLFVVFVAFIFLNFLV